VPAVAAGGGQWWHRGAYARETFWDWWVLWPLMIWRSGAPSALSAMKELALTLLMWRLVAVNGGTAEADLQKHFGIGGPPGR
jgi:hypothetical protein